MDAIVRGMLSACLNACAQAGVQVEWESESLGFGVLGCCELDDNDGLQIRIAKGVAEPLRYPVLAHEVIHLLRQHPLLLWAAYREATQAPEEEQESRMAYVKALRAAAEIWARYLVPESRSDVLVGVPERYAWERIAPLIGCNPEEPPPAEPLLAQLLMNAASRPMPPPSAMGAGSGDGVQAEGEGESGGQKQGPPAEEGGNSLQGLGEPDPNSPFGEERGEPNGDVTPGLIEAMGQSEKLRRAMREQGYGEQCPGFVKFAGTEPGGGRAQPPLPRPPEWARALRAWVDRQVRRCTAKRSYRTKYRMGDTRRHRTGDLPLRYVASKRARLGQAYVLFGIDTSGSMSPDFIAEALAVVQQAACAWGREVIVRLCDTQVHAEQVVGRGVSGKAAIRALVDSLLRSGGGGTRLEPLLEGLPGDVDACVIVTDGYFFEPFKLPSGFQLPLLFVLAPDSDRSFLPSAGEVLQV